jgi:hypothetical protein
MVRKIFFFLFLTAISLFIVATSPVWKSTKITELNELNSVPLGFPISFMEQSTTLTPMESDLPIYVSLMNPMEGNIIKNFSVFVFIIDVIIVFSVIYLIIYFY